MDSTHPDTQGFWWSGGKFHDDPAHAVMNRVAKAWEDLFSDSFEKFPQPHKPLLNRALVEEIDDQSVEERLNASHLSQEDRDLLSAVLASDCSAPCGDAGLTAMMRWHALSGHRFDLVRDAVGTHFLKTESLINAIADNAKPDVRFSSRVVSVEQGGDSVVVRTRGSCPFRGQVCIVTAPLNTLSRIEFRPPLAREIDEMSTQGQASRGIKIHARVRGPESPIQVTAPDGHPLVTLVTTKVAGDEQMVVGFGPDYELLDPADTDRVAEVVKSLLPRTEIDVLDTYGYDWNKDEFACGTWSIPRPGQLTRYLDALQTPQDRVLLSGSDVARGWNGFMDGAVETGLHSARVAADILKRTAYLVSQGRK